jgi:methylmalonyl-CoA mutase N-terminal domain/subunit
LKNDCEQNGNLVPTVIEAVKEYVTVGEIIQVMKDVYGEYEEPIFF